MTAKVRHRHRLKKKELASITSQLERSFPIAIEMDNIETAEVDGQSVLLIGGKVYAFVVGDELIPSLRSLLESPPQDRYVEVDMGAVRFVANGADIMSPGVVDADPQIVPEMLIWVRDEKNKRPLAIGRALISGEEMEAGTEGKAVKTLHYVGDKLWDLQL